jgi:hypothetical protein
MTKWTISDEAPWTSRWFWTACRVICARSRNLEPRLRTFSGVKNVFKERLHGVRTFLRVKNVFKGYERFQGLRTFSRVKNVFKG